MAKRQKDKKTKRQKGKSIDQLKTRTSEHCVHVEVVVGKLPHLKKSRH